MHEIFLTMNKKVIFYSLETPRDKNILPRTNFTRKRLTVNFFQTTVCTCRCSYVVACWLCYYLMCTCDLLATDSEWQAVAQSACPDAHQSLHDNQVGKSSTILLHYISSRCVYISCVIFIC